MGGPGVSLHWGNTLMGPGFHITHPASRASAAAAAPPLSPSSLWAQSTAVPGRGWPNQDSLLEKTSLPVMYSCSD